MALLRFPKNKSRAALCLLAASVSPLLPATSAKAVTAAEADLAFASLNKVYWDATTKFFKKEETGTGKADFWLEAQLWDTVMDQYDRSGNAEAKNQIGDVYDGFIKEYPDWTKNKYNDDIMWWSIACGRAYGITKDDRYLKKSKSSFDFVYDKFADTTFGGGVYWTSDKTSKNSCINCPAAIAAVRLSILLKDPAYLEKAKAIYAWQKKTLTDGKGKVFDAIHPDGKVANFSLTYNQGTYIGAAVLLYQQTKDKAYLDDAVRTAQWTKDNLCVTDRATNERILKSEGQGDAGAFKGIFIRYMKLLIVDAGRTEFLPWMKANGDVAWRDRRPADNIMGMDWANATPAKIQSQTAGSAATAVIVFADPPKPATPATRP